MSQQGGQPRHMPVPPLTLDERLLLERHGYAVPERLTRDEVEYWRMTASRLEQDRKALDRGQIARYGGGVLVVIMLLRLAVALVAITATTH